MRRVLHEIRGPDDGPTLIGIGGLHGNEPAGLRALEHVGAALERGGLARGEFVAVAGNLPAIDAGVRYVDRDLNRIWNGRHPGEAQEARQRSELRVLLGDILARARGPVHLLDLHTTSGEAPPFTVTGDAERSRTLALALPVPVVFGLDEALPGSLVHALGERGVAGIAFEAGRHDDPGSEERSIDALWLLLSALDLVGGEGARAARARRRLGRSARGQPRALRLIHRHALEKPAHFRMRPGFRSLQKVRRGELLALSGDEEIRAPITGRLLLPLYQPSGEDGFFMACELG